MSRKKSPIEVGGRPRVNLLPPEVFARGRSRAMRGRLIGLVVLSLVVVIAGYVLTGMNALDAQAQLAASQARTESLVAQQTQYAEATTVSGSVEDITNARLIGSSTEVLWEPVYSLIKATLPAGAALDEFILTSRAPWTPLLAPTGPLRKPLVASVKFVVYSPGPLPLTSFVTKLEALDIFADGTPDAEESAGTDGTTYKTAFTLNLSENALAHRFATTKDATKGASNG